MSPTHEELARNVKASRLAAAAQRCGFSADDVEAVNKDGDLREEFWQRLRRLAGVRKPSEESRRETIAELRRIEQNTKDLVERVRDHEFARKARGVRSRSGR